MAGITALRCFKNSDQVFPLRAREDGTEAPRSVLGYVLTARVFPVGKPSTILFEARSDDGTGRLVIQEQAGEDISKGRFDVRPLRQDFRDVAAGVYRWQVTKRPVLFGSQAMDDVLGENLFELVDRAQASG